MTDESDKDVDVTEVVNRVARPRRSPFDYAAVVFAGAGGLLLLAGILYAFAVADARDVGGTERFRLLAQASSPFVAAMALTAIILLVVERRRDDVFGGRQASGPVVMTVAAVVALVALLLAVNGIIVDLTTSGVGGLFRVSNAIGRLATVTLAGFALWLSVTAPPPNPGPPDLSSGR